MTTRVEQGLAALHARSLSAAPWVVAHVIEHVQGDLATLVELTAALSPLQRSGLSALPDPLPTVAGTAKELRRHLAGISSAEMQVLETAALMITDRVDILISASATEIAALLAEAPSRELRIRNGRFAFRDQRVRTMIGSAIAFDARYRIHRALSRASHAIGMGAEAEWHTLLSDRSPSSATMSRTMQFASDLLASGNSSAALSVASRLAGSVSGHRLIKAQLLAARAALAGGHYVDASRWARQAARRDSFVAQGEARSVIDAAASFMAGPPDHPDPIARLMAQVHALRIAAVTETDRRAVASIEEVILSWQRNRGGADARQAALFLSKIDAPRPWPWDTTSGPLSPLVSAWLCAQQVWFQLYAGEEAAALAMLTEAVERYPITHTGGGMTRSAAQILAARGMSIGAETIIALEQTAPTSPIGYWVEEPRIPDLAVSAARRSEPPARKRGHEEHRVVALTSRQSDVLRYLLRGRSNLEISTALGISPRTVEVHLTQVFRKFGVRSRSELIAQTYQAVSDAF